MLFWTMCYKWLLDHLQDKVPPLAEQTVEFVQLLLHFCCVDVKVGVQLRQLKYTASRYNIIRYTYIYIYTYIQCCTPLIVYFVCWQRKKSLGILFKGESISSRITLLRHAVPVIISQLLSVISGMQQLWVMCTGFHVCIEISQ